MREVLRNLRNFPSVGQHRSPPIGTLEPEVDEIRCQTCPLCQRESSDPAESAGLDDQSLCFLKLAATGDWPNYSLVAANTTGLMNSNAALLFDDRPFELSVYHGAAEFC